MKILLLILSLAVAVPSYAAEQKADRKTEQATIYAKPDISNLMRAMLRTSALDATNPEVREDYLLLHECELYRSAYRDEFELKRLVDATAKLIQQQRAGWPNAFTYETPLQLGTYDFTTEQYQLGGDSQLKNVNSFALLVAEMPDCISGVMTKRFPGSVAIRIEQPITVTGIPLPRAQAEQLLARMQQQGTGRTIYARFSFIVSFMPPVDAMLTTNERKLSRYTFDGRLMQIEFFEDKAMSKLIWTLTR